MYAHLFLLLLIALPLRNLEAVLTIKRQINICEFNVVLPNSESLGNQRTPTSDDGGTSLGSGNLRASLRGLRETLNLGEAEKRGIRAGFQMHSAPPTRTLRLSLSEKVTGFGSWGRRWGTGRCKRVAGAARGGIWGKRKGRLSLSGCLGVGECGCTRE